MERVITFVRAIGSDMAFALGNCTQFRETSLKPPPLPQQGEGQTARGLYLYILLILLDIASHWHLYEREAR